MEFQRESSVRWWLFVGVCLTVCISVVSTIVPWREILDEETHDQYLERFVRNEIEADGKAAFLEPCKLQEASIYDRHIRHQIELPVMDDPPWQGCK